MGALPLLESKMAVPSASVLHAAHGQIASACASQNQAFLACKNKDANPAACLPQGEQVTGCVLSLMRRLNDSCPDQLEAYSACLDKNNMEFGKCRKFQAAFEECAASAGK